MRPLGLDDGGRRHVDVIERVAHVGHEAAELLLGQEHVPLCQQVPAKGATPHKVMRIQKNLVRYTYSCTNDLVQYTRTLLLLLSQEHVALCQQVPAKGATPHAIVSSHTTDAI
jgi:hypothetical protein